ncbi:N-acetyltransferase [Stutzerimonas zhaodongensis]|uniref:N-acetyltransferase n=1 Tax=Stutzerimonas TaxID=2901164 RepID=UPI00388FA123
MIRPCRPEDVEPILTIWLTASIRAHHFVDPSFWKSRLDAMRDTYLPASQTWVYEREGSIQGFVSLVDQVLAAIFVLPAVQGSGIGSALIEHAKTQRDYLQLNVYTENTASIAFYRRHGFESLADGYDEHTGHAEMTMAWRREKECQLSGTVSSASS